VPHSDELNQTLLLSDVHLANSSKQCHAWFGPLTPWYDNMTSSVKPEVHNVSQCHQSRTSQGHRQNTQKLREVSTCGFHAMRADTPTNRQTYSSQYFAPVLGASSN